MQLASSLPTAEKLFEKVAAEIIAAATSCSGETALVGIHSGGVWMMQRILPMLKSRVDFGKLDAAMYRDDFAQRGLKSNNQPTWIPFDVQGKHIILIDDIFYTGRTTRAAMNEIFDYGRPASITLAVLVNRGGAQLPISPQIVGAYIALAANQSLQLSQDTAGKFHMQLEQAEGANV